MKDFFGKEIVIGDKVLFSNCNDERILIGNVTEIGITRARIESFDNEGDMTSYEWGLRNPLILANQQVTRNAA